MADEDLERSDCASWHEENDRDKPTDVGVVPLDAVAQVLGHVFFRGVDAIPTAPIAG